ncbi:MAG TPA: cupredoxin domain-containing protein [Gaiellaceae bacterium]|nr:cupredoxin domain-containing protein [Gaiellaceae bacterium]
MSRSRLALTLTPALAAALVLAVPAGGRPAAPAATYAVTVTAKEYSFKLSRTAYRSGDLVTFRLRNAGTLPHDFKISKPVSKKTPVILRGKTASFKLRLTKKGVYSYLCTVGDHARRGMRGTFRVR